MPSAKTVGIKKARGRKGTPSARRKAGTTTTPLTRKDAHSKERLKPDPAQIRDELLAVWDADSPYTLPQLRQRHDEGKSLDSAGISALEAEGYVNKYNSVITRFVQVLPKLVAPSEARGWVAKPMQWIVGEVAKRAGA